MNFLRTDIASVLVRLLGTGVSVYAFSLSGASAWIGELLPFSFAAPEIFGAVLAAVAMLIVTGTRWNSSPIPRTVAPATVGTFLHIPAILSVSSLKWANVAPSQISRLSEDTGVTETTLVGTFTVLIIASALAFILDSSKEETLDLERRGLDENSVRVVVKQSAILKIATLMLGLLIAAVVFIVGSVMAPSLGDGPGSIPVALIGFAGVLAIVIPVAMYFGNRTAPDSEHEARQV